MLPVDTPCMTLSLSISSLLVVIKFLMVIIAINIKTMQIHNFNFLQRVVNTVLEGDVFLFIFSPVWLYVVYFRLKKKTVVMVLGVKVTDFLLLAQVLPLEWIQFLLLDS